MNRILLIFAISLMCLGTLQAQQRYGFIETKYILENIPEYKTAKEQLDKLSLEWQGEVESIYDEIEQMHSKYRTDQVFLSLEMKEKHEKEIARKELDAQKLQQKYFGHNGELYIKRQELIKPIQNEVYDAVKDIAKAGNYGMIVDRSSNPTIIYLNNKFDLSDKVLSKLGYSAKKTSVKDQVVETIDKTKDQVKGTIDKTKKKGKEALDEIKKEFKEEGKEEDKEEDKEDKK